MAMHTRFIELTLTLIIPFMVHNISRPVSTVCMIVRLVRVGNNFLRPKVMYAHSESAH